jgi:glycosyltransferase involved in cell wall biosynthesis
MEGSKLATERRNRQLAVCIPTYKRAHLAARLVRDVFGQTVQPDVLIVVDGDPASGEVRGELERVLYPPNCQVVYVPSNHANLAYQRYLGWRTAKQCGCEILLYLDDDLRIEQPDAVEKVITPLFWESGVVGVTANIVCGNPAEKFAGEPALLDRAVKRRLDDPLLVRLLGAGRSVPPGGLTASGHRRAPRLDGQSYAQVEWLRGGVMAYRMDALDEDCFSDDLFALCFVHCGLGEDTFLSRRVGSRGRLLFAFCATFLHPDEDLPKAYPIAAYRFGYASAYSRRLLNDNYRGLEPPRLSDRLALVKSYVGTALLEWSNALLRPKRHRFAYAWGYTKGAFDGLFRPPTAKRLAPGIDWRADAEKALATMAVLAPREDLA